MTTSYYPGPPPTQQPPARTRSRRYVGWAVFLFFVPPTLVGLAGMALVFNDAHNEVMIEATNAQPIRLEAGGYFYATSAAKPGSAPCRLDDLTQRPRSRTRLEDARNYALTYQERPFVNRGRFDVESTGRHRLTCPGAGQLVVLRHAALGSWVYFLLPAGLVATVCSLVGLVMLFRTARLR